MKTLYPQLPSAHSLLSNVICNKFSLSFIAIIIAVSSFAEGRPPTSLKFFNSDTIQTGAAASEEPAVLKSFDASLASTNAELKWVSVTERNMSHYVIEKSRDGIDYHDITMIFANGGLSDQASYNFSDNLGSSSPGLVYYRLKMIDEKGKYSYSAVKVIKLNTSRDVVSSVSAAPETHELRITIGDLQRSYKVRMTGNDNSTLRIVKN